MEESWPSQSGRGHWARAYPRPAGGGSLSAPGFMRRSQAPNDGAQAGREPSQGPDPASYRLPPGLQRISATEGALRPVLPPTCPSTTSRAAPTDGSCGSQRTEHKAQRTFSSLLFDGEDSKRERSSTPRPSPRVRSPASSASQPSPRHRHRGLQLAGQPESAPPSEAGQTVHLWLATPPASRGLRWAQRGPRRRFHSPRPRRSPGRPSSTPGPIQTAGGPCRPGRRLAQGSRYFGQTPRPPSPSAPTPTRVPRKGSPRVLERCPPARPCHALPNLSAPSRLPDISWPRSPQQQFEAGQAPRAGYRPGDPSPAAGLWPAQSAASSAPQPLPSAPRPPLPEPPASATAPRPPPARGQPEPRTHPRPPSGPRAAWLQPGPGREAGPRPFPCAAARPARLVAPSSSELSGEWCRAESGGDGGTTIRSPTPRALRRGLRAALRAGGRGYGLQPGAPSARSAKCTPQARRPRPPRLPRLRCPPHSLLCRSPSLPSPLRSPPPRLQATPPASSPAAVLTPEWPEVPSPQHTATLGREELGGARCSSLIVWGQWRPCAFRVKLG